jgi:acyl transferase domain-containing protein
MPKNTDERTALTTEREELELENLRFTVEQQRSIRLQRTMQRERMALILRQNEDIEAQRRAQCKHRKGGKNKAGFLNGNDGYYSVITNTYPDGRLVVMCSRCQSEWEKPAKELRKTDPKLYRELLEEFQQAVNWPTDNEPSGSQLFLVTRDPTPLEAAALA